MVSGGTVGVGVAATAGGGPAAVGASVAEATVPEGALVGDGAAVGEGLAQAASRVSAATRLRKRGGRANYSEVQVRLPVEGPGAAPGSGGVAPKSITSRGLAPDSAGPMMPFSSSTSIRRAARV